MLDAGQRAVIALRKPSALVLAGPGCGKTHILARRVLYANSQGVPFTRMACLTFTNRAAREMLERVGALAGDSAADLPFVGNLHRFCLRVLFENELIHPDTAVLDDTGFEDYCRRMFGYCKPYQAELLAGAARHIYQREHYHPASVCLSDTEFTPRTIADARKYMDFKRENNLIDFDDILLLAYTAMRSDRERRLMKTYYPWLQVDEVQDLTALHLAIIDEIGGENGTRLYLGDEQQAIFSFLGAGGAALEALKKRCKGEIHHLGNNYRSSQRLLEITNHIAAEHLGMDRCFLPVCRRSDTDRGEAIFYTADSEALPAVCSAWVRHLNSRDDIGSTMVLVRTNRQGETVSEELAERGIEHIFPGRNDVFRSAAFKTIWSHLALALDDCRIHRWTDIIYRCGAVKSLTTARRLVSELERHAFSPSGLLDLFRPSACEILCSATDTGRTIVVVDTETTGLDIENDDIIQLSAVKTIGGEPTESFNVFIDSALPVPDMVGGIENPLAVQYAAAPRLTAAEAFAQFVEFVGDDAIVAGHNTDFDMAMLRNDMRRRTGMSVPKWVEYGTDTIDTQRLARLLHPRLRSYRLGSLLETLGIDGVNSHNALDDARATAALMTALIPAARRVLSAHAAVRRNPAVLKVAARLAERYKPLYDSTKERVFNSQRYKSSLSQELVRADEYFTATCASEPLRHRKYIERLIDTVIVNPLVQKNLYMQLSANLNAMLTFNEGDFFANNIVEEKVRVMTIHKAKGLESDAVIVYDANRGPGRYEDYLRVLYVAFSRARKVLVVGAGDYAMPPLDDICSTFDTMRRSDIRRLVHGSL